MLDLNLSILSTHKEDEDSKAPTSMFNEEEASTEGCISFGILRREDELDLLPRPPPPPPPDIDLSGGSEWLNLSSMQQEMGTVKKTKSRRGPKSRSSHYRGVTFYRRTGRWESHIWDCGKQVYLGGFDTAYTAARAYDRAAIKFRGLHADINFIVDDYKHDIEKVKNLSKEELVQTLRQERASLARRGSKYKDATLKRCTNIKNDHIHFFQNRGWNAVATQCDEMRNIEGDYIKFGTYNKGNEKYDLELSLGISSTSKNIKPKIADYYMDTNHSVTSLYGKPLPIYLPMTETKPLKTVIASSTGFPFLAMISSSSMSTCFDP